MPSSIIYDLANMNYIHICKFTGQIDQQTADSKVNASVFLFFPTTQFLKTIQASRTNGTFGLARNTCLPLARQKE